VPHFDLKDEQRIVRAIANAERGNRGEVRVHVEARCPTKDPLKRARALYFALKMNQTRDDTAVLLYVADQSRACAVWSGAGIHARGGEAFWKGVTDAVAGGYRQSKGADGVCEALGKIGELLRQHVPGEDTAGNELPNAVTTEKDVPAS
jgi:uncharacterized membrane protein